MWPWLMIIAGVLLIVGALIARHRMMRDYHERLAGMEADEPVAPAAPLKPAAPLAPASPAPSRPRITITEPTPGSVPTVTVPAPRTTAGAATASSSQPLFADRPPSHQLTEPPTIRVRALDVPLQDWLRYYAEGSAWSGVIQSISDRITGDRELQPFFGGFDRATLQRHVMSTVMMLTGDGVTVGAVRRLAGAHLQFVQAGGDPITEPVWDRLVWTFKNALREHGVPESAVNGIDVTAAPLKAVIVSRGAR